MIINILLFAIGFVLLIKGGDWFVDGSVGIANHFNMPKLLVGATIVSIGTTLPEVMVSSVSAVQGHSQIAYGNAIGSIICNTALIASITLIAAPSIVKRKTLVLPSAFFFGAAIIYTIVSYTTGFFSRGIGITFLAIFVVYIIISVRAALKGDGDGDDEDAEDKGYTLSKNFVLLVIGAAVIAVGSKLLVDNGTAIASALGVPESVIGLTFVALGTSLPELITAIQSLRKGHGSLSLGNVIGANLFNIVLVGGMSITLSPFNIPSESKILGYNASLLMELPVMLLVMLILTLPALIKEKLTRAQGFTLLAIYAAFVVIQFTL